MAYTTTEFGQQMVQREDEDSCAQCGKDFDFDIEDDNSVSVNVPEEWNGKNFCSKGCMSEYWFTTLNREKQRSVVKVTKAMFNVLGENFSIARDSFATLGLTAEFDAVMVGIEALVNELNAEDYPAWVRDEMR
jgi:hypothetical protein